MPTLVHRLSPCRDDESPEMTGYARTMSLDGCTAANMYCHPCIERLLCFFFIDSSCFRHRRQRTEKERQEEETSALSPFQRVLAERARRLEEVSI